MKPTSRSEWEFGDSRTPRREQMHVKDLVPDPANRRKHTPRNVGMVVDALHHVGAARSIVIDEDNVILAGNGVTEAAAEAGITDVRVVEANGSEIIAVRRRGLTEEQKRALAMYDNRTAELAEWDTAQLGADFSAGLDLKPWFSEQELRRVLPADIRSGLTDPDHVPTPQSSEIEIGDLFALGNHKLLCGDGTDLDHLGRVVDTATITLLVTSPPYNQQLDRFSPSGMQKEASWVAKLQRLAYADSLPESEYQEQQVAALNVWHRLLADHGSAFYNHKNRYRDKHVVSPLTWLPGPFALRQEIVWSRGGGIALNARMFMPSDERIYWLYKGDDFFFDDTTEIKSWATVWDIGQEVGSDHAAPYPTEIPRRCIQAASRRGATVLDPYAGSGTTLIACEQLDRQCCAVEIDARCCQVTIDRWEAFTGQKALKVGEAVRT